MCQTRLKLSRHVNECKPLVMGDIRRLVAMSEDEIYVYAKEIRAPLELVRQTRTLGRLPTVNFAAGGVATPAVRWCRLTQ